MKLDAKNTVWFGSLIHILFFVVGATLFKTCLVVDIVSELRTFWGKMERILHSLHLPPKRSQLLDSLFSAKFGFSVIISYVSTYYV